MSHDRVECAQRFVKQQCGWVAHQGTDQRHTLALPTRQRLRASCQQRVRELHLVQQDFGARQDAVLVPAEMVRQQREVVAHAQVRKQAAVLNHIADAVARFEQRASAQPLAFDCNLATVRRFQPEQQTQQGRFAATAAADHGRGRTGGQLQADVVDGRLRAVVAADVTETKHAVAEFLNGCGSAQLSVCSSAAAPSYDGREFFVERRACRSSCPCRRRCRSCCATSP